MSDSDDSDIIIKRKNLSNYELKTVRSEKLASLSKSYSDIYKKYGYPTFQFNKKPSTLTLPQLDESDFFDESDIKKRLLKDTERSETKLSCPQSTCSQQADMQSCLDAWPEAQDESCGMIIGKGIYLKKNKKKRVTICTTHCRYSSIRRVAAMLGMREVLESDPWQFMWLDSSITVDRVKHMKRFQRINHFPGMMEICRKDLLARNLNRMRKSFPNDYNFFPLSWSLPTEFNDALKYNKRNRSKTFILKPECSSQGKGIFLVKNLKDLSKVSERFICQEYLSKPYTIDGFKFDIRIYTLISSCDPLRIYVYNEGLVRFATQRYAIPDCKNTANHFIHLTNFSINRRSANFVHDENRGSKRKISTVNAKLESRGIDVVKMWLEIDKCIVKTIIAGWPMIRHNYKACFPMHDMMSACFEILGFDILLDYKLRPYILEVNHSPSFHTETSLDGEVKENLLLDTFNLLNIWGCDSKKVIDEDRKRTRQRLFLTKGCSKMSLEGKDSNKFFAQDQWEMTHLGNFRRVYPSDTVDYEEFFNQTTSSLYTTTESIRRKAQCAKQLRNDLAENKAKTDIITQKKLPTYNSVETCHSPKGHSKDGEYKKQEIPQVRLIDIFEPVPYAELDDRKRSMYMENRASLLRTYGITRQVYKLMKENGSLRENDIRKYSVFDKAVKPSNTSSSGTLYDVNNNNSSISSLKFNPSNVMQMPPTNSQLPSNLEFIDPNIHKYFKYSWSEVDKQTAEENPEKSNIIKFSSSRFLNTIAEIDNEVLRDNLIVKTLLNHSKP